MNLPPNVTQMRRSLPVSATDAYEILVRGVVDYAIFLLDPDGYVISWNAGAERIKGYKEEEVLGEHFSRFYTEEDRAAGVPERALRIAVTTGRFGTEGWRQRKNGERFWAMVVIDAIHQHGELVGFAKVTRDMTEQREAMLARLESERRFRLLVEGVTDYAIYMLDPAGRITNWNAGAERIKGYKEAEIVGEHFSKFYTPEDQRAGLPARALETARREGRYGAEGWRVRKDGSRFWASAIIDAIYDGPTLIGFAKITRDLTERREAELRLEQSRALLAQSQKLDAIGQLTAGMAHDFNNLLTGISGALEILVSRLASGRSDGLERLIGAAQDNAKRAANLTHSLLAFSRRQTLDPRPVSLNELLEELKPLILRSVTSNLTLVTVLAPDLWQTRCDRNLLENALLNICLNANEAMPRGGQLQIETSNAGIGEQDAREMDMAPGDYVSIALTDTGIGMSEDVAARAFDPFFTTKALGRGTGLGLSMVHGFSRQSGGQVRISSQLGVGTTVQLLLPRYAAMSAAATPPEAVPAPKPANAQPLVLVVDDEPTVRMLLRDVLEDLGYIPLEAADGAAAMDVIRSAGRLDLLISDVGLPGMNGREFAAAARRQQPGLKVLFITGYAETNVLDPAQLEPGMEVLTKPFSLETLMTRVEALVAAPS